MTYVIPRSALLRVTELAARQLPPGKQEQVMSAMCTTGAVAVGWWHCKGAECPMRQIRHRNQGFHSWFDGAMLDFLGIEDEDARIRVEVTDD
jgi:hypothetical protein